VLCGIWDAVEAVMEVIVSVGPDIGAASRVMMVEYSRCTERLYVVEAVWGAVISLDWSGVDGVWSSNLKDHYRGVGGDCLEAGTKVELSRVTSTPACLRAIPSNTL
jgi:hypothetical protein